MGAILCGFESHPRHQYKSVARPGLATFLYWWNYTTLLEYILNKIPDARAERVVALNEIVRSRPAVCLRYRYDGNLAEIFSYDSSFAHPLKKI